MLLAGLLEYFPTEGSGTEVAPTTTVIIEVQARFIERVLLRHD